MNPAALFAAHKTAVLGTAAAAVAGLIGLYIVVANGSNFGTAFSAGAAGVSQVTKTLQGRP